MKLVVTVTPKGTLLGETASFESLCVKIGPPTPLLHVIKKLKKYTHKLLPYHNGEANPLDDCHKFCLIARSHRHDHFCTLSPQSTECLPTCMQVPENPPSLETSITHSTITRWHVITCSIELNKRGQGRNCRPSNFAHSNVHG
jgi:hypothetical protein